MDVSKEGRMELDSHADTIVGGSNCVVIETTGRNVSVLPYNDEYESIDNIPIATIATAYDCPLSGQVYILVFNEALYFGERMKHTLLCPNQMRDNGIIVEDTPKQYNNKSTHSIYIPDRGLTIPLSMEGVVSGFDTRTPTADELDNVDNHIEMTSAMEWDPNSSMFASMEKKAHKVSALSVSISAARIRKACDTVASYKIVELEIAECDFGHIDKDEQELCTRLIHAARIAPNIGPTTSHPSISATMDCANVSAIRRGDPHSEISVANVAKKWGIGYDVAKRTLQVTTQVGVRSIVHPAQRRFTTAMPHLRYPKLQGTYHADTMQGSVKSIRGFKYAHIIGNGHGFSKFYPMITKNETVQSLDDFVGQYGIMERLITDGDATMESSKAWKQAISTYKIQQRWTEPHSPWQNRAEIDVREAKRGIQRFMKRSKSPKRLWCFCGELVTALRSHTAYDSPLLRGRCAAEAVLGYSPDISVYIQHEWYEQVWYRDVDGDDKVGYWLGPALKHGGGDSYWILPMSCKPMIRSTVWSITVEERQSLPVQAMLKQLYDSVESKIGDHRTDNLAVEGELDMILPEPDEQLFDDDPTEEEELDKKQRRSEADEYTPELFDKYINAQVLLPRGGENQLATVVKRCRNMDGIPTGTANDNPILDTREFIARFDDGAEQAYSANIIAENLYSQVDSEGKHFAIMKDIIDHEVSSDALQRSESEFRNKGGSIQHKRTTKGWRFLIEWKDGTSSWVDMKDLKESNPIELAEYAIANMISTEPAFIWWVPHTIRKRDRIIKKVKTKYWKRTHKYGIELPKTIAEAFEIDRRTGTKFWTNAIAKEMRNVMPAFEFNDEDNIPKGYKEITLHGIFDVKMDLTRKFRLVGDGHKTEVPEYSVYSSVVSRDSVRLFFLLAALNDLEVMSADIQNAYLTAPAMEHHWTRAGPEFGEEYLGRPCKIVRALYGLRSSGKAFHDYLSMHLKQLGFTPSRADPDVWMQPGVKKNGDLYWKYVITYVDDICCAMEDPNEFMKMLGQRLTLKEGSVKEPDMYLGADVKKFYIEGAEDAGKPRWAMSSETYVKRAIADVEIELKKIGSILPTKVKSPLSSGYRPELDITPELNSERQNYYQGLIGVLRWICELGRIDILNPISLLSRYLASAREGHLDQVFHVFAYLKAHDRSTMVFDDTYPVYNNARFLQFDWSEHYPDAAEAIPDNIPGERGKPVVMSCFVDADHAGCRETRRSHTGILIYVNRAPIQWFSKRQNTVEASTYGSEMLAMRIAIEMIEGLRYKLRMFGVPIDGPCNVFCDNNGVVLNTTIPDSKLTKKHAAINYHRCREAIAAKTIRVAKEDTKTNLSDCLTKLLDGVNLRALMERILW